MANRQTLKHFIIWACLTVAAFCCFAPTTIDVLETGSASTIRGDLSGGTSFPVTNLVATVFTFASVTNQLTMNKELWNLNAGSAGSLTNVSGTGYATLRVSNSTAGSIAFQITNATLAGRANGDLTTNLAPAGAFAIPAGRIGYIYLDNRIGNLSYACSLERP